MALHLGTKLSTIGIVIAILIMGFSPSQIKMIDIKITPSLILYEEPLITNFPQILGPKANPRYTVVATGYNSLPSQTDSTPHITSTGKRTSFGIIAASRDLLTSAIPYGSLVRLSDLGTLSTGAGTGHYQDILETQNFFIVEDTMHARKRQQVDIWFAQYDTAINWGIRRVEVELIRYGRDGPLLNNAQSLFNSLPVLRANGP